MSVFQNRKVVIVLCFVVFIVILNVGLRFYSQFRTVPTVTASEEPLSSELRRKLPSEIATNSAIKMRQLREYDPSEGKILTRLDLRQIRSELAWSRVWYGYWPERIEINNGSNVVAVLPEVGHLLREVELRKEGNHWQIADITVGVGEPEKPGVLEQVKQYLEVIFFGKK